MAKQNTWLWVAGGVGALVVYYLYTQSQASAAAASNSPTGGAFPYFQTAALPSSVTDGGGSSLAVPADNTASILSALASLSSDQASVAKQQSSDATNVANTSTYYAAGTASGQNATVQSSIANQTAVDFGTLASNLFGGITSRLSNVETGGGGFGAQQNAIDLTFSAETPSGPQSYKLAGSVGSSGGAYNPPAYINMAGQTVGATTPVVL